MKCLMVTVCLLGILTGVGGCLVAASSNDSRTGNYVSQNTINQIMPGQTTKGWVEAIVGEPTSKVALEDNTEVWKYTYSEKHESDGAVFLIFGGSSSKETSHTLFVEFHADKVTRTWVG